MKKIALVYSSKSGHTKQYADWLKDDVGDMDVIPVASFSPSQTMTYKLVIFACGVYGDKLSIMDYVKKNINAISPQKTMVMAVSWYTNDSEEAKKKLIEENYPEQFKNVVPIFVLNSGVDKKSLSAMDKMKLTAAQVMIDKKDGRSSDDINALAIIKGYSDQTSKDNLASIKQAIDVFFNPPKAASPSPSVQAKPAAAPAAPAAKPAPAPAPKPMEVSEMKNDADALNSLENAFKALKAPKAPEPKPEPEPKPVPEIKPEPAPVPQPKPKPKANIDPVKASVASSVKDAIAALSSGEMITNYAPAPTFEIDDEDAATYSEAVADSIMLVNQAVAASNPVQAETKPAETPAPKPVQTAPKPAETPAPKPVQTAPKPAETPAPKPVQTAPKPAEAPAPKPVQTAPKPAEAPAPKPVQSEPTPEQPQRKNSYMELFAKRRRNPEAASSEPAAPAPSAAPAAPAASAVPKAEEIHTAPAAAPKINETPAAKPAAASPKPAAQPAPKPAASKPAAKPAARPAPPAAPGKSSDAVIDFDFIMDDGPVPTVEAPKPEPAPTASAHSLDMDVYDFISDDSKPAVSSRAMNAVQDLAKAKAEAEKEKLKAAVKTETNNDIIEKMRHDIEALAEESEHEIEVVSEEPAGPAVSEEDDEGLEGFTFSNDIEYDLEAEFAEPVDITPEKTLQEKESKTNLDIRKLQEEINASIEQNKATKEKMEKRYGKKEKEEYHNPFAVQFEEDESKNKKKKKTVEVKRLADPIDPDIFFSKAGKDYDSTPGAMPEIKFRNR